jgi:hypothetical protein
MNAELQQPTGAKERSMTGKISRRNFVGVAGAALGGGWALPGIDTRAQSGPSPSGANPDPQHIEATTGGYRLRPTGVDDHPNLEWALQNVGPGGTVRLVAGTYKMGKTAIVPDFDGKLVGAGANKTTITCTDELSYELWEAPGGGRDQGLPHPPPFPRTPIAGSLTKAAPGLFFFYKTPLQPGEDPVDRANRIEVRNLRCRGAMIGEPWAFGDEVLCFTVVNSIDWSSPGSMPHTTRQDVLFAGVEVDGYATAEFPVFGNACACITVLGGPILTDNYDLEGATDGDALGASNGALLALNPAQGDVTFRDCLFRNCRLGPGVVGHQDGNLLFDGITTDGCRGNCLQLIDNSNCRMEVRNCHLFCDSFLLPPELTPGGLFTDIPSSLGCVVALQGSAAAVGFPSNLRWLTLALDPAAHAAHPEAGPLGTWRPLGPALVPAPSTLRVSDNSCLSSGTPNSYCVHIIDVANLAFAAETLSATIRDNRCTGSQTCIGVEHVNDCVIRDNRCDSLEFGIELHNAFDARLRHNRIKFPNGVAGCEVRTLALGEKIDFYHALHGAGSCSAQD